MSEGDKKALKHTTPSLRKLGLSETWEKRAKMAYDSFLGTFPPLGSVEIRDLIQFRVASPIVLFYHCAFGWFIITNPLQ